MGHTVRSNTLFGVFCCIGIVAGSLANAQDASPLPVAVKPTDTHIRYVGRFDTRDPAGPRCSWSASMVELRFRGSALNAQLKEAGHDRLQVVVDGKPTVQIEARDGAGVYSLASGLPAGIHMVELVKRTEPFVGTTQILGFSLSQGGALVALPARPGHRIEIVGDSITCGYGNEGKSEKEHFTPETENAFETYGAIAARSLGAEYSCVAWSGRKMWPDDTMGEIYDRALAADAGSAWDFSRWIPDVVVVNLATNDFGKGNPDEKGWTTGYEAFLARVRKAYPKAEIYCATGPMMGDSWPPGQKALSTLKSYLERIVADEKQAGDTKVHAIDFDPQDSKNGLGADWHPNVKTHEVMAATLEKRLERDLGWKPVDGAPAAHQAVR